MNLKTSSKIGITTATILFSFMTTLMVVQFGFYILQTNDAGRVQDEAFFSSNDSAAKSPDAITANLKKLAHRKVIACPRVELGGQRLLDLSKGKECRTSMWGLQGGIIRESVRTAANERINFTYLVRNSQFFRWSLWACRIIATLLLSAVWLSAWLHRQRLDAVERAHQETQRYAERIEYRVRQVAHDMRSPLSAINIVSAKIPGPHQNLLKFASERLNMMAQNVLDNCDLKCELVDICEALQTLIEEKRAALAQHVCLNAQFPAERVLVKGVRGDLLRAFSNLLNNALEAVPPLNARVDLTVRVTNQMVKILVTDNGRGMAPDTLRHAGKRGFTFGKAGHGLGLSFAKTVFEDDLAIRSVEGAGTEVEVRFAQLSS